MGLVSKVKNFFTPSKKKLSTVEKPSNKLAAVTAGLFVEFGIFNEVSRVNPATARGVVSLSAKNASLGNGTIADADTGSYNTVASTLFTADSSP